MKIVKRLPTALLGICLLSGLTGCLAPRTKVLDPNSDPVRMAKGVPYGPPCDGYFVPDSTMLRILDRLSDKDVFGPAPATAK